MLTFLNRHLHRLQIRRLRTLRDAPPGTRAFRRYRADNPGRPHRDLLRGQSGRSRPTTVLPVRCYPRHHFRLGYGPRRAYADAAPQVCGESGEGRGEPAWRGHLERVPEYCGLG